MDKLIRHLYLVKYSNKGLCCLREFFANGLWVGSEYFGTSIDEFIDKYRTFKIKDE